MSQDPDYEVKQAIGATARLGGYTIKQVATADDMKERTLTIRLTRTSNGWQQDRLPFEDLPVQTATVDRNGHVESINSNPSALEILDPDQGEQLPAGDADEKAGAATEERREGTEMATGEVVEINSKKKR